MSINHGANLYDLSEKLGIKKEEILDFSSNINPFGASEKAKKKVIENIDSVSIYPDPEYVDLRLAIGKYAKCNKDNIVLGGGATELITAYISIINPKKALILYPSYSEYEKELSKIEGCEIYKYFARKENDFKVDVEDFKKEINKGYDLVIICNPNNPTGFAFSRDEIKSILEGTNTFIMLDETYIEFTDTDIYSSTPIVDDFNKLFIIRGTSKFFSTPGIRLGYGLISDESIKKKILKKIPLWNINVLASIMGEAMFLDEEFIEGTKEHTRNEIKNLENALKTLSYVKVYETRGNFVLCEILNELTAKDVYDKMMDKGMIIRNCLSFEGLSEKFFRVCILKEEDNKKLIRELLKI